MMWKEFNCHLIGGRKLFALRNEHKAWLTAAQRSGGCKLISVRSVDSLCHARPDQIGSSSLS
jgi:hypothetical protein